MMRSGSPSRNVGRRRAQSVGAAVGDLGALVTDWVEEAHLGIASRAFSSVGPAAWPVKVVHNRLAGTVYAAVRGTLRAGGRGAGLVAAQAGLGEHPVLWGQGANRLQGVVCGFLGDRLRADHPDIAIEMAIRNGGEDIGIDAETLREAFPSGGRRIAVFLHGLCETESSWGRPADDDDAPGTYGDQLRRGLGMAPVFIRYNSGLKVWENGRLLADLLENLVGAWPDTVDDLALIGHSMGGLLIRAACDIGVRENHRWVRLLRDCCYLGTPHDGAPLERSVDLLARNLRRLPETRAIASFLDARSEGIKNLRFGFVPEETEPSAPDTTARPRRRSPGTQRVRHHVVGATLGATRTHLLSRTLGDLLVTPASAAGTSRYGPALVLEEGHRHEVGGITHFQLLEHPEVAAILRTWLAPAAP